SSGRSAGPPTTTPRAHRSAPHESRRRPTAQRCNRCCTAAIPGPSTEMVAAGKPASLAGVVLAGAASLRNGRDKALKAVPDGLSGSQGHTTMVEHVVGIVGQRCDPVFVVSAPGQSL